MFHQTPEDGWNKDSVLSYSFDIQDTASAYDILLHIRHTERYQFQNMWLFLNNDKDTIEFYLADSHGVWLGNRGNGTISMPVLYEENYRFPHSGTHTISLRHGMRQDNLRGITGIGVQITKSEQ
jgi:gliding motility-associated lipoprotein GldH